jgi:hypothetical protein
MHTRPALLAFLLASLLFASIAGAQGSPAAAIAPTPGAALGLVRYALVTPTDDDCTASEYYDFTRAIEDQAQAMLAPRLQSRGVAHQLLGQGEQARWNAQLQIVLTYCKSYGSRAIEADVLLRAEGVATSPTTLRWEEPDGPPVPGAPGAKGWSDDPVVQNFLEQLDATLDQQTDGLLGMLPPEAKALEPAAAAPAPRPEPAPAPVEARPAAPAPVEPPAVALPVAPPKTEPRGPAPIVAVFDIQDDSKRYKPAQLQQLSEYLAGKLAEKGAFRVVPRDQLRARLQREKTQTYQECYDMSCQIELGKAVAAEKSLATKLLRFGTACSVSLTLYDLRSEASESEGSATEDQRDCSERELLEALRRAVNRLTAGR